MTDDRDIQERLDEFEYRLIAQEHRPLALLKDLREQEFRSDKWWGAMFALVLRTWFSNPVLTTGAGIVAITGVVLAYQANRELQEQNNKLDDQNSLLGRQNVLLEQQNTNFDKQLDELRRQNEQFQESSTTQRIREFRTRRAELLSILYGKRECLTGETAPFHSGGCPQAGGPARANALRTLVELEDEVRADPGNWNGVTVVGLRSQGLNLIDADLRRAGFDDCELDHLTIAFSRIDALMISNSTLVEAVLSFNEGTANQMGNTFDKVTFERTELASLEAKPSKFIEVKYCKDSPYQIFRKKEDIPESSQAIDCAAPMYLGYFNGTESTPMTGPSTILPFQRPVPFPTADNPLAGIKIDLDDVLLPGQEAGDGTTGE